jgi:Flp pilus assembly protein TadG
MKRNSQKERGSQIVEFAVILPVLLLLALIVAEGANLFRVYELVTNAAREGARLSVLSQNDYVAINQTTNFKLTNPQTCTFSAKSTTSNHPVCQAVADYVQNNEVVGNAFVQCPTVTVTVDQVNAPASDSANSHYSRVDVSCTYSLRYLPRLPSYTVANAINVRRTSIFRNLY